MSLLFLRASSSDAVLWYLHLVNRTQRSSQENSSLPLSPNGGRPPTGPHGEPDENPRDPTCCKVAADSDQPALEELVGSGRAANLTVPGPDLRRELRQLLEEGEAVITVPRTARILRISEGAAYRAARAGAIPVLRFGRSLRVPVAALLEMLGIPA